jgi:hypothetical protein
MTEWMRLTTHALIVALNVTSIRGIAIRYVMCAISLSLIGSLLGISVKTVCPDY